MNNSYGMSQKIRQNLHTLFQKGMQIPVWSIIVIHALFFRNLNTLLKQDCLPLWADPILTSFAWENYLKRHSHSHKTHHFHITLSQVLFIIRIASIWILQVYVFKVLCNPVLNSKFSPKILSHFYHAKLVNTMKENVHSVTCHINFQKRVFFFRLSHDILIQTQKVHNA